MLDRDQTTVSSSMMVHQIEERGTYQGFDASTKKVMFQGYFIWLVIGYTVGISLTYLVFYLMDGHGQPALLYLVPCTLGLIVVLGGIRGELSDLWNYKKGQPEDAASTC